MAAFRKFVIALAVLAVFTGLASAQTLTPMQCSVQPTSQAIRAEGKTEQVGDIVINCTSGNPITDGGTIPLANFTVQISGSSAITSRVMSAGPPKLVDAVLAVDEPGATTGVFGGFGSDQAPTVCTTLGTDGGCTVPSYKQTVGGNIVMSSVSSTDNSTATAAAPNVFQGVVSGSGTSVTFLNVPILPTGSTISQRVFRITNIRVDATGGSTINANVIPSLSTLTTGFTSIGGLLQINGSSSGAVATVSSGLKADGTKVAFSNSAPVCVSLEGPNSNGQYVAAISFAENFGTAFKTRYAGTAAADSVFTVQQSIPGVYGGESGYNPSSTLGVADFGTRLKAHFTNIPAGVRLFVSATNVVNASAASPGNAASPGTVGSNATTSFAQLISTTDETTVDGPTGPPAPMPDVDGEVELTVPTTGTAAGTATAVWEVFNTNPGATETFTFAVYMAYTANVPPVTGTGTVPSPTVNLTYAPTSTSTTVHPIPNFVDAANAPHKLLDVSSCRTVLLFPYITSNAGFDTGIAISNTTNDAAVFGDTPQNGACSLNWYPTGAQSSTTTSVGTAVAATTTPTVVAGTTYLNVASALAPGFTGYMIAACNFQLAHGFAFVADWGNATTSSAMGYLALVIPDVGSAGKRTTSTAATESLGE